MPDGVVVAVDELTAILAGIVVVHLDLGQHVTAQLLALAAQLDHVVVLLAVAVGGGDGEGAVLVVGDGEVVGAVHGDGLDGLVGGQSVAGAGLAAHVKAGHSVVVDVDAGDGVRGGGNLKALVALVHQLIGVVGVDGGDAIGVGIALVGGEEVAVQRLVTHEGGVADTVLVQVDVPHDLLTLRNLVGVTIGGAVVGAGVHVLGGVVAHRALQQAVAGDHQAHALVIGQSGPADVGAVAVLLGLEHLLAVPVGVLAHGVVGIIHLGGVHAHGGAALAVHVVLVGTTAIEGEVVIVAVDDHTTTDLGQTVGGKVAGGDELAEDHDLAVAVDLVGHQGRGGHLHGAVHGHEHLVLAGVHGDLQVGQVLGGAGVLQVGVLGHGGVVVGLSAVQALLGALSHDHVAVQAVGDDGAALRVQHDLELLAVVGGTGEGQLVAHLLGGLEGLVGHLGLRGLSVVGVELELLIGHLVTGLGPVGGVLEGDGDVQQVVAALLGLKLGQGDGDILHLLTAHQGLTVHVGGVQVQSAAAQLGQAVLGELPSDVEGVQGGVLILVDHLQGHVLAGGDGLVIQVEVHLLVDLLGLSELGRGSAVSKHQTVAAEGVVVVVGVDPVAAVAPELVIGAIAVVPHGADGLVNVVPDEAALSLVVLTDGIPVLQCVAVGLAHGVVVLGVDEGHASMVAGHVVGQHVLGGLHVHDVVLTHVGAPGVLAVGLHVGVLIVLALTLVLAQTAGVTLEQVHGGNPEAVVLVEGSVAVGGLVAQRPHDDAGVVLVHLQVGGHTVGDGGDPLGHTLSGTGGHLHAVHSGGVALDVGLGAHVQAQLIGQVVQGLVVGVVSSTDGVEVVLLHQGQIGEVVLEGEGMSGLQIGVVAVDTTQHHLTARDLHLLVALIVDVHLVDLTEADALHHGLHDVTVGVLELQHQRVQVGSVGEPLGGVLDLHGAGDGGARVGQLVLIGTSGLQLHGLMVGGGHGLTGVIHNVGGNCVSSRLLIVEGAHVGLHGDVHVAVLAGAVVKLGLHEEVPDFRLVLGVQVHITVNTALADEVLVLQPAADGPTEHLQSDGVLTLGEVGGDVEVVGGEGVGGIAHLLAVDIQVVGGLHALEGDEHIPSIPVLRHLKGGAVVAYGVVYGGGVGVAVAGALEVVDPGQGLVGVNGLVVLKSTVLIAVGLPGLGHILRLEGVPGVVLGQIGLVYLFGLFGGLHQGEVPVLAGQQHVVVRSLRTHVVQHGLLCLQSGGGVLIGDELALGPLTVDADDFALVVPLVTGNVGGAILIEADAVLVVLLPHLQHVVIDLRAGVSGSQGWGHQSSCQERCQGCRDGASQVSFQRWFHVLHPPFHDPAVSAEVPGICPHTRPLFSPSYQNHPLDSTHLLDISLHSTGNLFPKPIF